MYVERDLKIADLTTIVALVGPRQAGKTTLLKESSKGKDVAYLMFDDPDVLGLFDSDIKKFENEYLEGHGAAVLDEVQYGKDAGPKLKYLADKGRKLYLTSSSETLLGKDVLSYLVGRVTLFRLYPFSLPEFQRANGQKETTPLIMRRLVFEHVMYGGYPNVVLTSGSDSKKLLLKNLYETMVLKDVARVFSIDDLASLERMARYLSHYIGNQMVYESMASDLGLSFQSVKKYLDALEKCYLVRRVEPFYTNKLKEVTKQPKLYFIDTGLRNVIANHQADVDGRLFENYVFCELLKAGFVPKHWQSKSGAEVDFIIEKEGQIIPIEVKLKSVKAERSLRSFISAYSPKNAFVISYEAEPFTQELDGCKVFFTDIAGLLQSL